MSYEHILQLKMIKSMKYMVFGISKCGGLVFTEVPKGGNFPVRQLENI